MVETKVQVDTAEADSLFKRIEQSRERLGMSLRESIAWGGTSVSKSIGARTKVSDKYRRVVELPIQRVNSRGEADGRYARFGYYRWRKGVQELRPLMKKGRGRFENFASISEAKKSKKVVIGRRGLAKRSWGWLASNTINGGVASMMGVPDTGSVEWSGGYTEPAMRVTNRLRYMEHALEGGYSAVQDAFTAAANKMGHEIERKTAKTWVIA